MSFNPDVRSNVQQIEYQKFVQIEDDTRFPPISVIRNEYADSSTASVSSLSIYPKTAVLTYDVGSGGAGPGGAYTKCETRTSGNPSFTPAQIYIHNLTNVDRAVALTLISGMTCTIAVGKNTAPNHAFTLNLAVSGVTNYDSCSITYFA